MKLLLAPHKTFIWLVFSFLILFAKFSYASSSAPICEGVFNTNQKIQIPKKQSLKDYKKRLKAAWDISAMGAQELKAGLHEMDNMLYYAMTALMARENIMVDGPGGGAKTLGISNTFNAQKRAINALSKKDRKLLEQELNTFKNELVSLILKDKKETDPQKKIFTQQFHATISESKILGGPDLLKYVETGEWVIDYKKALISDENMFAILDEIEKAPPAVQMTLLSILNERQALVGNSVINTMLDSIASTTNATASEFISQALPHEVGGRRALLDRFIIKIHSDNVSIDGRDEFLLIRKIQSSKKEKKYTIIDLKGLRDLIDQVEIPQEVLNAMTEISTEMDRRYNEKLLAAIEEAEKSGSKKGPQYYPPFSGSNRIQSKVDNIWKSAFLVKQIMLGVDFSTKRMTMAPADLLDLAPILLHGGPDSIVPEKGFKVNFLLKSSQEDSILDVLQSNNSSPANNSKNLSLLSTGIYDPHTQIFQYVGLNSLLRNIYFDAKKAQLVYADKDIDRELIRRPEDMGLALTSQSVLKKADLENRLLRLHNAYIAQNKMLAKKNPVPSFKLSGRMDRLIAKKGLRESSRNQLKEIKEAHDIFLDLVHYHINNLTGKSMTPMDKSKHLKVQTEFENKAKALKTEMNAALTSRNKKSILEASAKSVKNAYEELSWLFNGSTSSIKAMFVNIINQKNLMIFGPPGSAKTMMSRMVHAKELDSISELQVKKINSVLSDILIENKVTSGSLYVKQFHPMSTEGDIVGRLDLAAIKRGEGYTYNRDKSLSAKDVYFALLDEFEKAPPGVRTSLLSIMNERILMDGDSIVKSNIIALVIATNATPGEFIVGSGDFSTAFPIYDRVQNKAYSLNKLQLEALKEFHEKIYAKVRMELHSPLMIYPLTKFSKNYFENLTDSELNLMTDIKNAFLDEAVSRSDAEHRMHLSNSDTLPDFYINARGESKRSGQAVHIDEVSGSVILNRILEGDSIAHIEETNFKFDPKDLKAYAELLLTYNPIYEIQYRYEAGKIYFYVETKDLANIVDRLDSRETRFFENLKWEHDQLVVQMNHYVNNFLTNQALTIARYPKLFPSAFATPEDRKSFLLNAGIKEDNIEE